MKYDINQIEKLIPQRSPIVMLSVVTDYEDGSVETELDITNDNIFADNGKFLEAGLIEHAAQSAAALIGVENLKNGSNPKVGFIGAVQNFKFYRLPTIGETIKTKVCITTTFDNISLVQTETTANGEKISEGTLKTVIAE
ncbi:MAG: hydroxymyristoyl-ACP dehydratase [Paludibacteraceae bacterium]|nr:hydroxymyristoyl-ACP dehydratase [Paludibacteraceae bacterium]